METKNIGKTHLMALKEENGRLRNVALPIERPEQFIAELRAMVDNPNRTVWDMQSLFQNRYQKTIPYLDYIHPYSYSSSYVSFVQYPKMKKYDEIKQEWENARKSARENYLMRCRQNNTNPSADDIAAEENKGIAGKKEFQKIFFCKEARHWIDASCYHAMVDRLGKDGSIKMHSKEQIGWNDFSFKINEDTKVVLQTNFGYGSAAYFLLYMQYKGLNILPYSHIVKYYIARTADVMRCTRSYLPSRDSWDASFDFVADFVNQSVADPEGFVKNYIMNEVREMMAGLERISTNSEGFMKEVADKEPEHCVINLHSMGREDRQSMQAYPEETPILFKVEKITGALDFLKSLTEIAKEVELVQPYIDRLLELNASLCPEIEETIQKITGRIEYQMEIKAGLDVEAAIVAGKLTPYAEEIAKLQSAATKEKPFDSREYERAHPDYVELRIKQSELVTELYKVNRLINDLKSFISLLNRSLAKIEEFCKVEQAA